MTANNWLAAILREEHEKFQPTLTAEQNELKQKLQGLSGSEFDHQYIEHMVQDHEKTIPLFEREAKEGHNPTIKSLAEGLTRYCNNISPKPKNSPGLAEWRREQGLTRPSEAGLRRHSAKISAAPPITRPGTLSPIAEARRAARFSNNGRS